ncbi:hypothetical protein D3C83_138830 [compost metagenome]
MLDAKLFEIDLEDPNLLLGLFVFVGAAYQLPEIFAELVEFVFRDHSLLVLAVSGKFFFGFLSNDDALLRDRYPLL